MRKPLPGPIARISLAIKIMAFQVMSVIKASSEHDVYQCCYISSVGMMSNVEETLTFNILTGIDFPTAVGSNQNTPYR